MTYWKGKSAQRRPDYSTFSKYLSGQNLQYIYTIYNIYTIYTIYTIFYRRRSRSPRRPRQRPVLVEAEAGELEAEDQVFPYLDTEKKEWFLAAAANNVTTLAIIDIY